MKANVDVICEGDDVDGQVSLREVPENLGLYDLLVVTSIRNGLDFEALLFENGEEGVMDLSELFWLNFGSVFGEERVFEIIRRVESIASLGVQKYRALSIDRRKELFDLDMVAIGRLKRCKVDTLLTEGATINGIFETRQEPEEIGTIRDYVGSFVDAISEKSSGVEGTECACFGNPSVLNLSRAFLDRFDILFPMIVDHLQLCGFLRSGVSLEQVVFNDEIWQEYRSGVAKILAKELLSSYTYNHWSGRKTVDIDSLADVVESINCRLEILREIGFMRYLCAVRVRIPKILEQRESFLKGFIGIEDSMVDMIENGVEAVDVDESVDKSVVPKDDCLDDFDFNAGVEFPVRFRQEWSFDPASFSFYALLPRSFSDLKSIKSNPLHLQQNHDP